MTNNYEINGEYLRSEKNIESSIARAFMQGAGFSSDKMRKRPIIGICNSSSEFNPCNINLDIIVENVKQGVIAAGGVPVEFPTISIHEQMNNPYSLMLRNLMAMDVEEMIRKNPIDGVVLLNGCDKTVPAQVMGAISADKPTISLAAGPRPESIYKGNITTIHSLWEKKDQRMKGEVTDNEWENFTNNLIPGPGTCNVMGTASTMSSMMEALGLSLPGTSFLPASSAHRRDVAQLTGQLAVEVTEKNDKPSKMIKMEALENAFRTVCALGGSTNAVIHIEAIAGRLGLRIGTDTLRYWSENTPQLVNVIPSGPHSLNDFHEAGGIPALFKQLDTLLHLNTLTVTGETWSEIIQETSLEKDSSVLKTLENPVNKDGGLAILKGPLAPESAVYKRSAVPEEFWVHQGPALVFDGLEDMEKRIDNPDLDVCPESVLILRGMGPIGGPGMPESAKIPIPKKMWDKGIRNMLRISDGRMSGTADGAVVLHVAPESAVGGPLALVQDGDIIELDAINCSLNLQVEEEVLKKRRQNIEIKKGPERGYEKLYHDHVTQANLGADFDFLIPDIE